VRFVEGHATATGYTSASLGPATGIEIGDVIRSLDGKRVDDLLALWRPLYSASNEAARSELIGRSLPKGPCGAVPLEVDRDGKALTLTAERARASELDLRQAMRHDHPGAPFRRLSDDVAYLTLASVKASDTSEYVRRAAGAKLLVVDIRNYPSEFVVFALGRHLVPRKTEFARFTVADGANPGSFVWGATVSLDPAEPRFEGRVAILVDETSMSQAEYTTMAFRVAPGAVVVGSTTAGADGNVSRIPLPGGRHGMISGIGVFYPDRRPTQRIGIVPDVVARPTRKGIRAGMDEVLEAALREILGRGTTEAERTALRAAPPATQ
jgi:C-terminal processing protease CtpA/Prc